MVTDIKALYKWSKINKIDQNRLLANVFCPPCGVTTVVKYHIEDAPYGIVLVGKCKTCRGNVARVVENNWFEDEDEVLFHEALEIESRLKDIHEQNKELLLSFGATLTEKGLSTKTIEKHLENTNFYINEFLCCYEPIEAKNGWYYIDDFLGDWFVREAMWSSPAQVKENATSIKKFYGWMSEIGMINKEDYKAMCEVIKEEMPIWLENAKF